MIQWEYCKILEPTRVPGKIIEPTKVVFLGISKQEEKVEEVDTVEHTLARLGLQGWELISHHQVLAVVEQNGVMPVLQVYYLKRQAVPRGAV